MSENNLSTMKTGEFEKFVQDNFEHMPTHKVANVFLQTLGAMTYRIDEKGQDSLTKNEIMEIIQRFVKVENDPKTTVKRLLDRAEKKKIRNRTTMRV